MNCSKCLPIVIVNPRDKADTFLMLESLGNKLDNEVQAEYEKIRQRYSNDIIITQKIEEQLDIPSFIRKSENWDGGYVIAGMLVMAMLLFFAIRKVSEPVFTIRMMK